MTKNDRLVFGTKNAKLGEGVLTFSKPAGKTCPGAQQCMAWVKLDASGDAHVIDGPRTEWRCFAATMEARYPSVRKSRERNAALLGACQTVDEMVELILRSLPGRAPRVRVGVSGDYASEMEFRAWMMAAAARPQTLFYGYTKSLPYWVDNKALVPANFNLTASKGGKFDSLIAQHNLKYAEVVFSVEQAAKLGLEIDHDDSHAYGSKRSFALLIHSTQPAGTQAAKAVAALARAGYHGYGKASQGRVRAELSAAA